MAEYIDKWQAVANLMDAGLKDAHKAVNAIQFIPAADVRENGPILTKADEIRAMSDEELAEKFCGVCVPRNNNVTYYGWLDWLKSPVEVEDRRRDPETDKLLEDAGWE